LAYEHLNITGQGQGGEAVYATTAVSGSLGHSQDDCVSAIDLTLLYALETDKDRHWTMLRTKAEAEAWEDRLARSADSHCRSTTESKGRLLRERLQPAFAAVDRYIAKLGKVTDIFASEFRFFQTAPEASRRDAERLASLVGSLDSKSEDVELACLVLFLFAAEIEERRDAFRETKWHSDPSLRVRIYLLADYLGRQRMNYADS
jgi:hypothetical protein